MQSPDTFALWHLGQAVTTELRGLQSPECLQDFLVVKFAFIYDQESPGKLCRSEGYVAGSKSSSASDPPHVSSLLKHVVTGTLNHMQRSQCPESLCFQLSFSTAFRVVFLSSLPLLQLSECFLHILNQSSVLMPFHLNAT